jgi:hypothetical protein
MKRIFISFLIVAVVLTVFVEAGKKSSEEKDDKKATTAKPGAKLEGNASGGAVAAKPEAKSDAAKPEGGATTTVSPKRSKCLM